MICAVHVCCIVSFYEIRQVSFGSPAVSMNNSAVVFTKARIGMASTRMCRGFFESIEFLPQ